MAKVLTSGRMEVYIKESFFEGVKQGKGEWKKKSKNGVHFFTGIPIINILGQYFNDLKQGYGEMYWDDGSNYTLYCC